MISRPNSRPVAPGPRDSAGCFFCYVCGCCGGGGGWATLVLNDLATKLPACAAGHGIAQTFEFGIDRLLASGELVQILTDWTEERFPLFAYHPARHVPPG